MLNTHEDLLSKLHIQVNTPYFIFAFVTGMTFHSYSIVPKYLLWAFCEPHASS